MSKIEIKFDTAEQANEFNRLACEMKSDISVYADNYMVDGKSILGLFSLDFSRTLDLEVVEKATGEKEKFINELRLIGIVK